MCPKKRTTYLSLVIGLTGGKDLSNTNHINFAKHLKRWAQHVMTYLWSSANWFVYCLIKLSCEDYCLAGAHK